MKFLSLMPTETLLNDVEVRVAGSLVEKQLTTPDYYPLTLNALVHACNQISNRDPVVAYDAPTVEDAIDSLRRKNLVYVFYGSESRVPKYKHMMREVFELSPPELAALCVLMLRGPQTLGEVRGRAGRLHEFADLAEAERALDALARRDEPLVTKLPRRPGQKDARYSHLLAGPPAADPEPSADAASPARETTGERMARLESEVASLRAEVAELRSRLEEFRAQFE
jgi:uncharacterized protein